MSHFTPPPHKRKNMREAKRNKLKQRLAMERTRFDMNNSRPYKIVDTTWLSLNIRPYKKGMVKSFMILLNKPLPRIELQKRLDYALGDL